ncbi:MAG: hypothetical protein KF685_03610 [Acidobacteria bacterium]|nr:hypothetical protein [Acidobacteriota bacterium]
MSNNEIFEQLDWLFYQSQMQFGSVVKSKWLHTDENCPGCGKKLTMTKFKGKKALSLNTFIYRERGVLIGYLLCGGCVKQIFKKDTEHLGKLPLHDQIEKTLIESYLRKSGH